MVHIRNAVYIEENTHHFADFVCSDYFFILAEKNNLEDTDKFQQNLQELRIYFENNPPKTFSNFVDKVSGFSSTIIGLSSYVACFLQDDCLYVKTYGQGEVYLRRNNMLASLVRGDASASGYVHEHDCLVLLTKSCDELSKKETIADIATKKDEHEVLSFVKELMQKDNLGLGACATLLFYSKPVLLEDEEALYSKEFENQQKSALLNSVVRKFGSFVASIESQSKRVSLASKKKKFIFASLVVLFFIVMWSLVFGYKRRMHRQATLKIEAAKEIIDQKLIEAEDVSILNLARSQILIAEAKQEFSTLKKAVGEAALSEMEQLELQIAKAETSIVKKEDKKPEVFYDLQLIKKDAKAQKIYKQDNMAALLNSAAGEVYVLDLEKKSVDTVRKKELVGATSVTLTTNYDPIVYNKSIGIILVRDDNAKTVIEKDEEWGELTDMATYNNNLYIVDSQRDELYKYSVTQDGYSTKTTYIKEGQGVEMGSGKASVAIDSAVYVSSGANVFKFISGIREDFSVSLPKKEGVQFDAMYTDIEANKLYLLDKKAGTIYVVSKTGEYEKQINASVFTKADDFIVSEKAKQVYVLSQDKLLAIEL